MGKKRVDPSAESTGEKAEEVVKVKAVVKKNKEKVKTKALSQFLSDVLPTLKKEMTRKKKEVFDFASHAEYFKTDSKYLATYILPLFHFLEKTHVQAVRYGQWDNRHMVKTTAGFDRVMYLCKNADPTQFTSEVQNYCASRYGKEWFKIPSKDGHRAKAAAAAGHNGEFIIHLTGITPDSYIDKDGKEVLTINPILTYEPARPPIVREKKARASKVPEPGEAVAIGAPEEEDVAAADTEDGEESS